MKKVLSALCTIAMLTAMCGCSDSKKSEKENEPIKNEQTVCFDFCTLSIPSNWKQSNLCDYIDYDISYSNEDDKDVLSYRKKELDLSEDKFDDYMLRLRSNRIDTIHPENDAERDIYVSTINEELCYFDYYAEGYWCEFLTYPDYFDEVKEIMKSINFSDSDFQSELSTTEQGSERIFLVFDYDYSFGDLNYRICYDWNVDTTLKEMPSIEINDGKIKLSRRNLSEQPFEDDNGNEIKINSIDDYYKIQNESIDKDKADVIKFTNPNGLDIMKIELFADDTHSQYNIYYVYCNNYIYTINCGFATSLIPKEMDDFANALSLSE